MLASAAMILVTGTKRSGTSMWMQILAAAGLPVFGDRFPRHWGEHFAAANPDGFYESELIAGIYFRTNPHPVTGVFLFPEQTRHHAVKVFIPGLIRTDLAFIDRVIATVRPWRDFARSRERLHDVVREANQAVGVVADEGPTLPAPLEWWAENFALIRDIATRRYAVHTLSYESLLADPEPQIRAVLQWIGAGDPARACAVVRRERPPAAQGPVDDAGVEPDHLAIFDELYERIHRGRPLDNPLIERLNATDRHLRPRMLAHNAAVKAAALASIAAEAGAAD